MKKNNYLKQLKAVIDKFSNSIPDPERKKILGYSYIILTLVTVSFFGIFAITPTLSTISNLNKQYEDNKLIYEALNKKLSNLVLLDSQYSLLQADLPVLYNAIPETTKIPELTRQIESLAEQNGVILKNLSFSTVEIFPNIKNDPIYSFTFLISVDGSQIGINLFMENLINFNRIIGIDRIATGANDENRYTAEITGRAYFSKK